MARLASPRTSVLLAGGTVLVLLAIWLRLDQRHHGLLYPDGYQYLLMARGIGEHLRPTTVLGPGGDAFVPSFDAATKPLFAVVVAGVAELGVGLRNAGGLVAAVSSGLASFAGALLVLRLTHSAVAAAACALALLASPTIGFWWGFAGPDGLAVALAVFAAWLAAGASGAAEPRRTGAHTGLGSRRRGADVGAGLGKRGGAAGAGSRRRGVAAGVAAGLAIATRPELVVIVVACAAAAAAAPSMRPAATRTAAASLATVALVYALLRPPLDWSSQLVLAPLAGLVGAGVLVLVWRIAGMRAGPVIALGGLAGGLTLLAAAGRASSAIDVGLAEWPLVLAVTLAGGALWRADSTRTETPALAEGGRAEVVGGGRAQVVGGGRAQVVDVGRAEVASGKRTLLVLMVIAGLLVAVYAYKNPGSERYVANVLALLTVLVALGIAAAITARNWLLVGAIVALVGLDAALSNTPPAPGLDPFDDVAPQLAALPPGTIVSGTPDAYGVLLPERASRRLRPGARGFVVLDAGQRTYAPGFTARGKVVFRSFPFYGFVRPDGTVDRGPTIVVEGVALRTRAGRRP